MKFLKVGRVAIITRGRYAGKKVRNRRIPQVLLARVCIGSEYLEMGGGGD